MSPLLADLLDAGPPLASDDWSLRGPALELVVDEVAKRPGAIVECGSGLSTIVIARLLRELDRGSLHSLEHDPAWAERTRSLLAAEGLDRAEVLTAPLEPHSLAGEAGGWYRRDARSALPAEIDLLLIDGPPAGEPELRRSRHPALDELGPLLAPGATIILDDAERAGEAAAIELWTETYGLVFERDRGSGAAIAQWQVYLGRHVDSGLSTGISIDGK
jgi:predicted O-methyltransferase YrrM